MYAFLVCADLPPGTVEAALARARATVLDACPPDPAPLVDERGTWPELSGGWLALADGWSASLLSRAESEGASALVFGDVVGTPAPEVAARVLATWRESGPDAVAELDGSFAAVVVDLRERAIHVLSDGVGCRSARTLEADGFFAAPHDLPLVAASGISPELDEVSAASAAVCGWSVGGASLLRGVRAQSPTERLVWRGGRLETTPAPALVRKVDGADDGFWIEHARLSARSALRDGIAHAAGGADAVRCDLTAGIDSRVLAAAASEVVGARRLTSVTAGDAGSRDARVAAAVAKELGVAHVLEPGSDADPGAFRVHAEALALHLSGDTSAKRATQALPGVPDATPHLNGGGGEVFCGYYYPASGAAALAGRGPQEVAREMRARYLHAPPGLVDGVLPEIGARIDAAVEHLFELSPHAADVLDLFYGLERGGRWASMRERHPYLTHVTCPFKRVGLVREFLALPAGTGAGFPLYNDVLRARPALRRMLINDLWLLPDDAEAPARRFGRRVRQSVGRRVVRALHPPARHLDRAQGDAFAGPLAGPVREILTGSDGPAARLFGGRLEALLDEHEAGTANWVEVLGPLVTMELWWSQVRGAGGRSARGDAPARGAPGTS